MNCSQSGCHEMAMYTFAWADGTLHPSCPRHMARARAIGWGMGIRIVWSPLTAGSELGPMPEPAETLPALPEASA